MSVDIEQVIIEHSVRDVIRILENEPVQPDLVGQITVVQVMNRVSIAHLSIERALKFLITRAGGPLIENHHLGKQLRELTQHEPQAGDFLNHAFQVAVQHYRFNPNAANGGHLKSLESYLDVVGSDTAFQDLRYWELRQSPDEWLLRRLHLALHMELLRAVRELLRGRPPTETVSTRVERAVHQAMFFPPALAYTPGSPQEASVHFYLKWRQRFASWSDALADAVRQRFMIGDEFASGLVVKAYRELLEHSDPAVCYFAGTLAVLPRQPRDEIPPVEWFGPSAHQRGIVSAPSGAKLGEIERSWDGLWNVTPFQSGQVAVAAKAANQTDARCYLATLFGRIAEISQNGEERQFRIVATEDTLVEWNEARVGYADDPSIGEDNRVYEVIFWDVGHGLKIDDQVKIMVRSGFEGLVVHSLMGVVRKVEAHAVWLSGGASDDLNEREVQSNSATTPASS